MPSDIMNLSNAAEHFAKEKSAQTEMQLAIAALQFAVELLDVQYMDGGKLHKKFAPARNHIQSTIRGLQSVLERLGEHSK